MERRCSLLSLANFMRHDAVEIRPCVSSCFLLLSGIPIPLCRFTTVYPFTCWMTCRWFPVFGDCAESLYKNSHTGFPMNIISLGWTARNGIAVFCGKCINIYIYNYIRNCFPNWLYHIAFLPATHESSSFTFSPELGSVSFKVAPTLAPSVTFLADKSRSCSLTVWKRDPITRPHVTFPSSLHSQDPVALTLRYLGFPGGAVVKNPPANTEDEGSVPKSGRSPGEGNGNLL